MKAKTPKSRKTPPLLLLDQKPTLRQNQKQENQSQNQNQSPHWIMLSVNLPQGD